MLFQDWLGLSVPVPQSWEAWSGLFKRGTSPFDPPLILLIDEFDRLPAAVIDELVSLFRDLYLHRQTSLLHGLALVGVRAVLMLHVPNLTSDEVREMYAQYRNDSGQVVEPDVVDRIYEVTRGQPGLVSWLGELLTEKYNPGPPRPITMQDWETTYLYACHAEWNNTLLNLIKKARSEYPGQVLRMFTTTDLPFSLDQDWCAYLYMNGILDFEQKREDSGKQVLVCRFSSPFVQLRLYNALTGDLLGDKTPIPALDIRDDLHDVLSSSGLDLETIQGVVVATVAIGAS